jgi:hydrogenase nickel incorporation protein HypB
MCGTCGCAVAEHPHPADHHHDHVDASTRGRETVEVLTRLLDANDRAAEHNRAHLDHAGVVAINLMSSPGAGKTRLLEATIDALRDRLRIAVIEGDLETENDAQRIRAHGVPAVQITTGTACHLDANMVHQALHALDLRAIDLLFIENVGNLVCPASFDLGQHANVTLLSVTEGDDKPAKYPVIFRAADLVLLSKSDLLEVIDDFDPLAAAAHVRDLASSAPVLMLSARRAATLDPWLAWLQDLIGRRRAETSLRPQAHAEPRHAHAPARVA